MTIKRFDIERNAGAGYTDVTLTPDGEFCSWSDVELLVKELTELRKGALETWRPLIAERDELKEHLDLANRRLGELAHAPRTTGECSGCLELKLRLAVYEDGKPSSKLMDSTGVAIIEGIDDCWLEKSGLKQSELNNTAHWLRRIAALDEVQK